MFKITAPIIVFGRKKKRAIRRAVGLIVASTLTNQNGKTVYNSNAGNYFDLTRKEIYMMREILPKPKKTTQKSVIKVVKSNPSRFTQLKERPHNERIQQY